MISPRCASGTVKTIYTETQSPREKNAPLKSKYFPLAVVSLFECPREQMGSQETCLLLWKMQINMEYHYFLKLPNKHEAWTQTARQL